LSSYLAENTAPPLHKQAICCSVAKVKEFETWTTSYHCG